MSYLSPSILLLTYAYTLVGMLTGYLLAGLLNELGITDYLMKSLSSTLGRVIHPVLTPTLVLYVVSPRSAHAHASSCLRRGLVTPKDIYLVMMVSGLPLRLLYLYRIYVPVLIPLLGTVALQYLGIKLVLDSLLASVAITYGLKKYSVRTHLPHGVVSGDLRLSKASLIKGVEEGLRDLLKFLPKYSLAYALASVMIVTGLTSLIANSLKPTLTPLGITSLGLTYVTASVISPRAAVGIAKLMVTTHHYVSEVLATMLIGNAFYVVLNELWTKILPLYLSTYPRRVATNLLLIKVVTPVAYSLVVATSLLITH